MFSLPLGTLSYKGLCRERIMGAATDELSFGNSSFLAIMLMLWLQCSLSSSPGTYIDIRRSNTHLKHAGFESVIQKDTAKQLAFLEAKQKWQPSNFLNEMVTSCYQSWIHNFTVFLQAICMDKDIVLYRTCSYSAFGKVIHAAFWCAVVGGLIQGSMKYIR